MAGAMGSRTRAVRAACAGRFNPMQGLGADTAPAARRQAHGHGSPCSAGFGSDQHQIVDQQVWIGETDHRQGLTAAEVEHAIAAHDAGL